MITDEQGRYAIVYQSGARSMTLYVQVVREGAVLVTSAIVLGAGVEETIDLVVGDEPYRGLSDYEKVQQALAPVLAAEHVDAGELADFTEEELALLSARAGVLPHEVVLIRQSVARSRDTGLAAEVFYGLGRQRMPLGLPALLAQDPAKRRAALERALEENQIPSRLAQEARSALVALDKRAVTEALREPRAPGATTLGALLGAAEIPATKQRTLVEAYVAHQGPTEMFWKRVRVETALFGLTTAEIDRAQLTLQLGAVTQSHVPLVRALQARGVAALGDLAALDLDDWLVLIRSSAGGHEVGLPPDLAAAGLGQEEYAQMLYSIVEDAFPTAMLAHRIGAFPGAEPLAQFFAHNPGFEMRATAVATYLRQNPTALDGLGGETERAAVRRRLEGMQRIYRIAPRGARIEVMGALLADGIDAAQKVRAMGRATFLRRYQATLGPERAEAVWARASTATAAASVLLARHSAMFDQTPIHVLPARTERLARLPDYEALFGSLDFCSCEHCQSVHSPAAYLVDLLHWLHNRPSSRSGTSALGVLFDGRRADIGAIELSCTNTNTPLPAIDLINEVLERMVAAAEAPLRYQTTAGAADLAVHPEHVHAPAYEVLAGDAAGEGRDAVYPLGLPFDLWREEARVYLGQLGLRRDRLMEALHPGGPDAARLDPAMAAEALGMSPLEWDIIAGNAMAPERAPEAFWGMAGDPKWVAKLGKISLFLARARPLLVEGGMELGELTDLVRTRFVQEAGAVGMWFEGTACDTTRGSLPGLGADHLDRMHRFVRLRRRLGWSAENLDRAIQTLGGGSLDQAFLVKLAHVRRTADELRVRIDELLGWWGPVDTRRWSKRLVAGIPAGVPAGSAGMGLVFDDTLAPLPETAEDESQYDRLFQSRSVSAAPGSGAPSPAFAIGPEGNALADESRELGAHLPAIAGALGIAADELASLLSLISDDRLTLAAVSTLYRHISLARALGLRPVQLASVLTLTGIDPFDPAHPEHALALAQEVRAVQESGFTAGFAIDELEYLLRDIDTRQATRQAREQDIGLCLLELRDALRKVESDNPDPTAASAAMQSILIERLGAALGLELAVLAPVLTSYLRYPDATGQAAIEVFRSRALIDFDTQLASGTNAGELQVPGPSDLPAQFAVYRRLHKAALVLGRLRISAGEVSWVLERGPAQGMLDFHALPPVAPGAAPAPYAAWARLCTAVALRDRVMGGRLFDLLDEAATAEASADPATIAAGHEHLLGELERRARWGIADIEFLLGTPPRAGTPANPGALGLVYPADWKDERALERLATTMAVIRRIGLSADVLWPWRTIPAAATERSIQAQDIKQAARARCSAAEWYEVARPLRDRLREAQRDALVAWLVAHGDDGRFEDENALFEHLLLDVQMSPCQLTSRVKQAIGCVQLFVQRALMGLEPDVALSPEDGREWAWMKSYRVWEANRKVFLYPENWIEPELRDDKTPFFRELENELLQGEITAESAERAVLRYMDKLDEVARLEIVGLFRHEEDGADTLHVVGRTRGTPARYFYRQRTGGACWTPWEKIEVDIEGEHLVPVVYNRRLYLFWAQITDTALEEVPDTPAAGGARTQTRPERYYQLRLAWTERKAGAWAGKRLSTVQIGATPEDYSRLGCGLRKTAASRPSDFFFRAYEADGALYVEPTRYVRALGKGTSSYYVRLDRFRLSGCDGTLSLEAQTSSAHVTIRAPLGTRTVSQSFARTSAGSSLTLPARNPATGAYEAQTALAVTPLPFEVVPLALSGFHSQAPFFYQDLERTFFVEPRDAWRWSRSPLRWTRGDAMPLDLAHLLPELGPRPLPRWPDPWAFDPGSLVSEPFGVELVATPELIGQGGAGPAGLLRIGAAGLGDTFGARVGFIAGEAVVPRPNKVAVRSTVQIMDAQGRSVMTLRSAQPPAEAGGLRRLTMNTAFVLPPAGPWGPGGHDVQIPIPPIIPWDGKRYRFETFYHPYLCTMVRQLERYGLDGLLDPSASGPEPLLRRQQLVREYFEDTYSPGAVDAPYPREEFDFSFGGAYSIYNWEIFFHIPFLVARHLSRQQRFEEAQRWLHYIFDPTEAGTEDAPQRFWKLGPFFALFHGEDAEAGPIHELLLLLHYDGADPETLRAQGQLIAQIAQWRTQPFEPHALARLRLAAYQKAVVMTYIDNLIEWGDQLFRRDSMESMNEATQLYILAAQLLGRRPRRVEVAPPRPRTFDELLAAGLDAFSNALVEQIEGFLPEVPAPVLDTSGADAPVIAPTLFFCVPPNQALIDRTWDRVADRLFKIRHCMNIDGVVRQVPLFEPPIDPGLLVRAAAAGVDLASALSDVDAPMPCYRFHSLAHKADQLCSEVRSLGHALLSALEKRDSEALALLRAGHEVSLEQAVLAIREQQIAEARELVASLRRSRENAEIRLRYYRGREFMNNAEKAQLGMLVAAGWLNTAAGVTSLVGAALGAAPNLTAGAAGFGGSPLVTAEYGGSHGSSVSRALADGFMIGAAALDRGGQLAGLIGAYQRRQDDWNLQADVVMKELQALERQILAAEIRVAIAERERDSLALQLEHARETETFLRDKFTSERLFQWMAEQLSSLYFQSYRLAYDMAKRAERAWQHELAVPDRRFIQFGYWDSLKKGLLAGERLAHDLQRMEAAYLDMHRREYELVRHVSLRQLDPVALLELRRTGECLMRIPEAWFDMDSPGHYMRRIKTVAISIPAVAGPYAPVRCTLTLLQSSVRTTAEVAPAYARTGTGDSRFRDDLLGVQSIVTSGAKEDSGLFEPSLRDERYMPFEGAGVISEWRLELPTELRHFDYDTISDVIVHLRYTARDGGAPLRHAAEAHMRTALHELVLGSQSAGDAEGLLHLVRASRDLPDAWHEFLHPPDDQDDQSLAIALEPGQLPFMFQGSALQVAGVELFLVVADMAAYGEDKPVKLAVFAPGDVVAASIDLEGTNAELGLPHGVHSYSTTWKDLGAWTVAFQESENEEVAEGVVVEMAGHRRLSPSAVQDLIIVFRYKPAA